MFALYILVNLAPNGCNNEDIVVILAVVEPSKGSKNILTDECLEFSTRCQFPMQTRRDSPEQRDKQSAHSNRTY